MKVLKYILAALIVLIMVMAAIVFFDYNEMSNRTKAELWYDFKVGRQGSTEQQWFLTKSIDCDSTYSRALHQKSVAFNKRGDFSTGFSLLDKAVDYSPVEWLGYRGFIKLYHTHDYLGAIEDFRRLDKLTPQVIDAPWGEDIYYVIGLAYLQTNELDSAKKYFEKSISETVALNDESWVDIKVFLYAGITEQVKGNWAESIPFLDKGIQYDKRFSEAYYYRALAKEKIGETEESCRDLNSSFNYFKKGYMQTNKYFEKPYAVYASMINRQIELNCK